MTRLSDPHVTGSLEDDDALRAWRQFAAAALTGVLSVPNLLGAKTWGEATVNAAHVADLMLAQMRARLAPAEGTE